MGLAAVTFVVLLQLANVTHYKKAVESLVDQATASDATSSAAAKLSKVDKSEWGGGALPLRQRMWQRNRKERSETNDGTRERVEKRKKEKAGVYAREVSRQVASNWAAAAPAPVAVAVSNILTSSRSIHSSRCSALRSPLPALLSPFSPKGPSFFICCEIQFRTSTIASVRQSSR